MPFDISKIKSLKTFQFVLLCLSLLSALGIIIVITIISSFFNFFGVIVISIPIILSSALYIYINNKLILIVDILFFLKNKVDK